MITIKVLLIISVVCQSLGFLLRYNKLAKLTNKLSTLAYRLLLPVGYATLIPVIISTFFPLSTPINLIIIAIATLLFSIMGDPVSSRYYFSIQCVFLGLFLFNEFIVDNLHDLFPPTLFGTSLYIIVLIVILVVEYYSFTAILERISRRQSNDT